MFLIKPVFLFHIFSNINVCFCFTEVLWVHHARNALQYGVSNKFITFSSSSPPPVLRGSTAPSGPRSPHLREFTITLRHTTIGRTPLDEWSARRRDLYLTTHNAHNRQTSMLSVGFEPVIQASEQLHAHELDQAATGIGHSLLHVR